MQGARGTEDRFLATTEKTLTEPITGAVDHHPPKRGEIRQGVLLSVEKHNAFVDPGVKHKGLVPRKDPSFRVRRPQPALAVRAEVPVYVMKPEDGAGHVLVSLSLAQQEADSMRAEEFLESGDALAGRRRWLEW